MHDADARRHDAERLERLLSPFQQLVTFAIPFELKLKVFLQRIGRTEKINLHAVIDD